MSMPFQLLVQEVSLNEVINHAISELPKECCGLLGGKFEYRLGQRIGVVNSVYRLENSLKSEVEFLSSADSMFKAYKEIRQKGEEVLVVYHSHPVSHPVLSKKDLEMIEDTNVLHLIVGNVGKMPEFGLWWVSEEKKIIPCQMILESKS